jgi:transposase InsO family protein
MQPFKRFQIDTIVMAQGNNKKDDDGAWKPGQSLTASKDTRGLPDNGMRVVYHMIDLFTSYSFLAAAPKNNQDNAVRAVQEMIEAIRLQYGDGSWPGGEAFTIFSDDGEEYQSKFQKEVSEYEPLARLVRNPAGNPNADAVVEGANGVFRRIAKRYAENTKSKRSGGKSYLAYWFGSKKGEILQEINSLMNNRPVSSLGYQTPANVLAAAMAANPDEEDKEIVAKATTSKQGTARARRSASHITA